MTLGKSLPDIELDKRLANLAVNQGAILVYTSGTTGNPKGVMLSHDAVTFAARLLGKQTGIGRKEIERQVQYMPVNHAGASGKKCDLTLIDQTLGFLLQKIGLTKTNNVFFLVIGVVCMIAVGGEAHFAASDAMRGALVQHFKKIGPTGACFQVPRLWEKFHENLAPAMKSATGIKKLIIDWSMKQVYRNSSREVKMFKNYLKLLSFNLTWYIHLTI